MKKPNGAPALSFRRPNVNIQEEKLSTSGKYLLFIGVHYEAGHTCWVVGSSNRESGEIIMRHYNDGIPHCVAPKSQAYTQWEKFSFKMTERPNHTYEDEEQYATLKKALEAPGHKRRERKPN